MKKDGLKIDKATYNNAIRALGSSTSASSWDDVKICLHDAYLSLKPSECTEIVNTALTNLKYQPIIEVTSNPNNDPSYHKVSKCIRNILFSLHLFKYKLALINFYLIT